MLESAVKKSLKNYEHGQVTTCDWVRGKTMSRDLKHVVWHDLRYGKDENL